MAKLWRDFWICETGTGQQVAQIHGRYMMTMMMMIMMMMIMVMVMIMIMMMMKSEFIVHRYIWVGTSTLSIWVHVQAFCRHVTANMQVWVWLLQYSLQCGSQRCWFTHVITPPESARTYFFACFAFAQRAPLSITPQSFRPNMARVDHYARATERTAVGTA